jgi:hypothetical protein
MSDNLDYGSPPPSPALGVAGQVIANASLLAAISIYLGWLYSSAFLGYFHLNPLDLNFGVLDYTLRFVSVFSPAILVVAVGAVVFATARAWGLSQTRFAQFVVFRATVRLLANPAYRRLLPEADIEQLHIWRPLLIGAGIAATLLATAPASLMFASG